MFSYKLSEKFYSDYLQSTFISLPLEHLEKKPGQ